MRNWKMAIAMSVAAFGFSLTALAQSDKAATPAVEIGKDAPAFELQGIDGKTYKLSDYKDKIVVMEWVNKECPVCAAALPKMKELQKTYAAKGVVWLAIDSTSFHSAGDNQQWVKDEGIVYPVLMDTDGKVGHTYGARTTPHMFIVNKGKLVYMGAHDDKKGRNYIVEGLDALLAGKAIDSPQTKSYGCSIKYKKD